MSGTEKQSKHKVCGRDVPGTSWAQMSRISRTKNFMQVAFFCCFGQGPRESLGPFRAGVFRECPSGCLWGPSGPGLRSVQKESRECPRVSKRRPEHSGTLGHVLDTLGTPPGDTRTDTPGTLRTRRAERLL